MSQDQHTSTTRVSLPAFIAVLLFFFISGGCGLLYQVVWTRKLVLLFGTTSYAVSTVLSVFFLGLAIGSIWGGRIADRTTSPLRVYGVMEIIIGLWAIAFILFIGVGESILVSLLQLIGPAKAVAIALRAAMAILFLIVPVTLMGATLPLLARFVTAQGPILGKRIGTLYTLNTFGAVLGCAATGFLLLAQLGYFRTTLIGAVLNIGVGLLAILMNTQYRDAFLSKSTVDSEDDPAQAGTASDTPGWVASLVLVAFAVSGFCTIALEVLWTRLLSIVFLGTTYAFATMLSTVLCGIALGSAAASFLVDRVKHRAVLFGFIQLLTASACVAMLFVFPRLPDMLMGARVNGGILDWARSIFSTTIVAFDLLMGGQSDSGSEWGVVIFSKVFLSFLVLIVPTFLLGMSFPFALKAYAEARVHLGRDVGRLYAANTFSGVIGALIGGFVLVPLLGTHNGILLLSTIMGLMGLVLLIATPGIPARRRSGMTAFATASFAFFVWIAPPDISYAMNHWFIPDNHEIIHYSEGVEGTVVVSAPRDEPGESNRVLWINAVQATASIEKGVKMNRFQGVLPLLFDRELNNALFMCFGSGVTAGTLALSPFDRIDAVELSPDVLEAAPLFSADNFNVLDNPRVNPIVDDGRNFLLTTKNKYDLITFEPMPLALAGVSTFYTKEYYELCLAHLNDGGLVSQWIPLHNGLSLDVIRGLFKTFVDAFPEVSAWFINADMFLIGSNQPLRVDYALAEQRIIGNDQLREGLAEVYLEDIPELMASFFMGKEQLHAFAEGGQTMTDDRPWAEFLAPKMIYERNVAEIFEALDPHRESVALLLNQEDTERWPGIQEKIQRRHRAHLQDMEGLKIYYGGQAFSEPEVEFRKSLEIDPDDANAKYYIAEVLIAKGTMMVAWDEFDKAIAMLTEAREYAPHRRDLHLALGDAYFDTNKLRLAARSYQTYVDLGGAEPRAGERLNP